MARLDFDRCQAEIVRQTEQLVAEVDGADLRTPVPTCPGWDLGRLLHHLGSGHRYVEEVVRTRASGPVSDESLRVAPDEHPADYGTWLVEGARQLAEALAEAGPEAEVWTAVPDETPVFWARRFTHETAVHRADAVLALGKPYEVAPEVAVDAVDEWMELGSLPRVFDVHPEQRELLGPGRTLHLHATDVDAEWLVDLTGDAIAWRHAHEKAAVAVRGPVTELMLVIYGRTPPTGVIGDRELLDFWLKRVSFG